MTLQSSDPTVPPLIDPNYLDDPYDVERSVDGMIQSREIMFQKGLEPYVKGEHLPGPKVKTRSDVEAYIRQYGRTSYHHVGTCKMGTDDMADVDTALRVRGVEGLRVIDSYDSSTFIYNTWFIGVPNHHDRAFPLFPMGRVQ